MLNEQDNMIINVARNSAKFALVGIFLAPTYVFAKSTVSYKPVVSTRIAYTQKINPALYLRTVIGQLKPLAVTGAIFGASYTLFYQYFWQGLNFKSQWAEILTGHSLFGALFIAMFQPHWFAYGGIAGFFYGRLTRLEQCVYVSPQKQKPAWPDTIVPN